MHEIISSPQNPKIKNLKKLEKAGERRKQNLFLIEGLREVVLAHRAGYEIESIFLCEEFLIEQEEYSFSELQNTEGTTQTFLITPSVYESLAYRETTEGIIATARPKELLLENLTIKKEALVLVIEAVEKPGNLGAMLRTSDAAGVDAVIICDAKIDLYNQNVIRSSLGTVFTNQIAVCETFDAIEFLKANKVSVFAAELSGTENYFEKEFKKSTAIVVGSEATGLSDEWINAADELVKIPMHGLIDSLNVSVSAAILLFEAVRQRHQ